MFTKDFTDLFTEFPVSKNCHISIVIPVRNEAENIEKTLESFLKQVDSENKPLDFKEFEILILANNCTDKTADIIKDFRQKNAELKIYPAEINLPHKDSNIGFVRRILMDAAFQRLTKSSFGGGIIMTTDGDTLVAEDWIQANLFEIENGADAVGGRIIILDAELEKMDEHCRKIHLRDEEYRLLTAEIESLIDDLPFDEMPRHHQHFNASFAVKTEVYKKAGGVPKVKFLEDCAFFDSLQRIDARVRHSPFVKVYTSSRRIGRSEVGLSFQINEWKKLKDKGEDFLVESAEAIVKRFSAKRDLRKIWREFSNGNAAQRVSLEQICEKIFISVDFVSNELEKRQTFGAFYENLMREQGRIGEWERKFPPNTLDTALKNLKKETKKRRRTQSFSQMSKR